MFTAAELFALGWQHQQAGGWYQAEQLFRQVLQLDPAQANALNCLGAVLAEQGKLEDSVATFRHLVELHPGSLDGHHNLASLLCRQRKFQDAIVSYRQALRIHPDFPEALNGLGLALQGANRTAEAVDCFRQAVQLNPNFAGALGNLGNLFMELRQWEEAVGFFQQAVRVAPELAETHNHLGAALRQLGLLDESAACHRRALSVKPHFAEAHNNLGNCLQEQGKIKEAIACYRQSLRDMPNLEPARSNLVSCLSYDPDVTPEEVLTEHRLWGKRYEAAISPMDHRNDRQPYRRLRVGYVSPDFRRHALVRYLEPVLVNHDPAQVEVFCYAELDKADEVTERLQKLAHGWCWTRGLDDFQLAKQIRDDRIDILVDLSGHTANDRLSVFAYKPAPVQATWLGYMNTTGLTRIDYRLTDDVLDPPGQPKLDTEELWRLPGGFCCFGPPEDAPPVNPLPAHERGQVTFGSLQKLLKINRHVLDLWALVLEAVPTARLLMFHHTLTAVIAYEIRGLFAQRGIAAGRLDLRQGFAAPGYLGIYGEIDISLDTFPCTGGVTTCESLWMGVPVLTLAGLRPAGRNSAAILARAGLDDWVAQTPGQYVALAARWANDLPRLGQLRSKLRDRMRTSACDGRRFTLTLEEAYRAMWNRWCARA